MTIPASELAQIRTDVSAIALDTPCQVQRRTRTKDGMGSETDTWATIATVNAGITEPSAGQLANYDFAIGSLAAWQVKLPYGTDVQVQDRLVLGGQTLTAQVVLAPRSYAALLTVLASEVK